MATGRKSNGLKNRRNMRKPLPCVATSCHLERMVRRGRTPIPQNIHSAKPGTGEITRL